MYNAEQQEGEEDWGTYGEETKNEVPEAGGAEGEEGWDNDG